MWIFRAPHVSSFSLVSLSLVLLLFPKAVVVHANASQSRNIQILNQSGSKINIYWINRWNHDELVLNTDDGGLLYGADTSIDSYVTHEFEIQELPHSRTKKCSNDNENENGGGCRSVIFRVNENDNQILTLHKDFTYDHKDNKSVARDEATQMLQDCKLQIRTSEDQEKEQNSGSANSPEQQLDKVVQCVQQKLQQSLVESQNEIDFQRSIRTNLANKLETYACHDVKLTESTEVLRNETHRYGGNRQRKIQVGVYHDRDDRQIMYMDNAITPAECQAFENLVALTKTKEEQQEQDRALVANVPYTDATPQQKGMVGKWMHHMVDLTQTIMTTTSGTSVSQDLQLEFEPDTIVSIEYREGDHQPPPYQSPKDTKEDRVATMTVYCQVADQGGATSFSQAGGIHIQPTVGSVVLKTYVGLEDPEEDSDEFTQQSECPVVQGSKQTVTFHMRIKPQKS